MLTIITLAAVAAVHVFGWFHRFIAVPPLSQKGGSATGILPVRPLIISTVCKVGNVCSRRMIIAARVVPRVVAWYPRFHIYRRYTDRAATPMDLAARRFARKVLLAH